MEPQGGGGGPAPFLQKTYDMVDDSSSNAIVSWGSKRSSFIVWDPLEFARLLLPSYFKHGNFSSFVRQLNTYGFRKIDQEKWEFSNEDFVRGERHRLKNIHRRKPIHSHSQPVVDLERAALMEELEGLSRGRVRLREELRGLGNVEAWSGFPFEEVESKMESLEQSQEKLLSFLDKAARNPAFVQQLISMADGDPVYFSVFSKKRRSLLNGSVDQSPELVENSSNDGHCSTSKTVGFSQLFPQDFSNKLNLELRASVSNGNMVDDRSLSECRGSPLRGEVGGNAEITAGHLFLQKEVELLDTSVSLCQKRSSSLSWLSSNNNDEEQNISCQLTLASSRLPLDGNHLADNVSKSANKVVEDATGLKSDIACKDDSSDKDAVEGDDCENRDSMDTSHPVASTSNSQGTGPGPGRVNDVFWEQFLTERPGVSENEEASSCVRLSSEEIVTGSRTWMSIKNIGTMKL